MMFHGKSSCFNPRLVPLYLFCILVLLFLTLPVFIVVPMSFSSSRFLTFPPPGFSLRWYRHFFSSRQWQYSTLISIKVAITTMVISTILGTLAAFGLVRRKFKGKSIIKIIILSPMIIPVMSFAVGIYFFFVKLDLIETTLGLVLAHTVLAIPFVVTSVSATLRGFDEKLEKAAINLGASRLKTFLRITLPLIKPGIITGAFFAFIISFDEIIIAIFIAGTHAVTLPKQMWDGIRFEVDPTISVVSTLLICISASLVLCVGLLRTKWGKSP